MYPWGYSGTRPSSVLHCCGCDATAASINTYRGQRGLSRRVPAQGDSMAMPDMTDVHQGNGQGNEHSCSDGCGNHLGRRWRGGTRSSAGEWNEPATSQRSHVMVSAGLAGPTVLRPRGMHA